MTAAARVDLHDGHAEAVDALGVLRREEIALDDGETHLILQGFQRALQERRLARARRSHEIEHEYAARAKVCGILSRHFVIHRQNVLHDLDFHFLNPPPKIPP